MFLDFFKLTKSIDIRKKYSVLRDVWSVCVLRVAYLHYVATYSMYAILVTYMYVPHLRNICNTKHRNYIKMYKDVIA